MPEQIEKNKQNPALKNNDTAIAYTAIHTSVNLFLKVISIYDKEINKLSARILELEKQIKKE